MAAGKDGKRAQSFTSFGSERRGAPVEGFVRLSDKPIYRYSRIYKPDMVVLMDTSLLGVEDVLDGLKDGGLLLINSPVLPDALREVASRFKIALLDADSLARSLRLGPVHSPVINTGMLGAMTAMGDLVSLDAIKEAIREYFPDRWELNVEAADRGPKALVFLDGATVADGKALAAKEAPKRAVPQYMDKTAPCREACPIGADMEGAMRLLGEGKLSEAWSLVMEENPFPAVTGRVCFRPCEGVCNRGQYDEATGINSLERYLGDWALLQGAVVEKANEQRSQRVAVVGAGPAGLSCAYHLARLGYQVSVYDSAKEAGGVLRYGIPPYRLPKDIVAKEIGRLDGLGVQWHLGRTVGESVDVKEILAYDAVFLATGAPVDRRLGVPGEDSEGVISGLSLLAAVNSGQIEQARHVIDGRKVVVIGGGNSAVDVARTVIRLGGEVTMVSLERREEMPAYPSEIVEAEKEGVALDPGWGPKAIVSRNGQVTGLELLKVKAVFDVAGQFNPSFEDQAKSVACDVVITAIGQDPDLSPLKDLIKTNNGLVEASFAGATSHPRVFAGGDIVPQRRTVTWALGSGKKAALAIDTALRGEEAENTLLAYRIGAEGNLSSLEYRIGGSARALDKVVSYQDVNVAYFTKSLRRLAAEAPVDERIRSFREVSDGLTADQAIFEANRCFHCGTCTRCDNCYIFCPDVAVNEDAATGRLVVQGNYCKSCGICVQECPRGILTLERGS
jgi:2-oxoacid:acceptor oxidoreductase gamma subunit (pyruvate/2-ketoisovalerate family)